MRDPEIIEQELMEISGLADDLMKFERIVAWSAAHPDEVPFAMHHLMKQRKGVPTGAAGDDSGGVAEAG